MDEDHEIEDINEDDVEVLAGVIAGAILFVSVLYIKSLCTWHTSNIWCAFIIFYSI